MKRVPPSKATKARIEELLASGVSEESPLSELVRLSVALPWVAFPALPADWILHGGSLVDWFHEYFAADSQAGYGGSFMAARRG
jgi:hypothetical protein